VQTDKQTYRQTYQPPQAKKSLNYLLYSALAGGALGCVTLFNILSGPAPERDTSAQEHSGRVTQLFDHILTPEFMARVAFSESSGRVDAYNPKTKVLGRHQFKPDTFLEQLHIHGEEIGYGHLSKHIVRTPIRDQSKRIVRVTYSVPDAALRKKILDARKDPVLSERLAKRYIRKGLTDIARKIDGFEDKATEAMAYKVLHFGPGGALKAARALEVNPSMPFDKVVGTEVCKSNPRICYANKKMLSVEAVHDRLQKRLDKAPYEKIILTYNK